MPNGDMSNLLYLKNLGDIITKCVIFPWLFAVL